MWRSYPLTIGLPHTHYRNLSEVRLLMEAGHFFWQALGEAIEQPVSKLRSSAGAPIYATIYFVEEAFPRDQGLETFELDDRLQFLVAVGAFSRLALEARVLFNREAHISRDANRDTWWRQPPHPMVRFGSLFASVNAATHQLTFAVPANAELSGLAVLPPEDNPSRITREAQDTGRLNVFPEHWTSLDPSGPATLTYAIDPDRDTNAAGLVSFANYVAWMETGERCALSRPTGSDVRYAQDAVAHRRLLRRRIAYYGNPGLSDQIVLAVSRFAPPAEPQTIGLRYRLTRADDRKLLCLSEAVMSLAPPHHPTRDQVRAAAQLGT